LASHELKPEAQRTLGGLTKKEKVEQSPAGRPTKACKKKPCSYQWKKKSKGARRNWQKVGRSKSAAGKLDQKLKTNNRGVVTGGAKQQAAPRKRVRIGD